MSLATVINELPESSPLDLKEPSKLETAFYRSLVFAMGIYIAARSPILAIKEGMIAKRFNDHIDRLNYGRILFREGEKYNVGEVMKENFLFHIYFARGAIRDSLEKEFD